VEEGQTTQSQSSNQNYDDDDDDDDINNNKRSANAKKKWTRSTSSMWKRKKKSELGSYRYYYQDHHQNSHGAFSTAKQKSKRSLSESLRRRDFLAILENLEWIVVEEKRRLNKQYNEDNSPLPSSSSSSSSPSSYTSPYSTRLLKSIEKTTSRVRNVVGKAPYRREVMKGAIWYEKAPYILGVLASAAATDNDASGKVPDKDAKALIQLARNVEDLQKKNDEDAPSTTATVSSFTGTRNDNSAQCDVNTIADDESDGAQTIENCMYLYKGQMMFVVVSVALM